ncbi:MAG: TetR family transcriptional regulator [Pseudonocardia sp. SCN 72-86]|nr:MAG: TetR family transcriptional regulator [Pseudonocardia sp. SCN 72-86]
MQPGTRHSPDRPSRTGRPRSEAARQAVLWAVDDLLVEIGYAAMTMKGIAERAGVGRQTVYRWWSSAAEILVEACVQDAAEQLTTPADDDPAAGLRAHLRALTTFLTADPAGFAYRALVGEGQHDPAVRAMLVAADVLGPSTTAVLDRVRPFAPAMPDTELAAAQLCGPVLAQLLTRPDPLTPEQLDRHATGLLAAWGPGQEGAAQEGSTQS